MEATICSADRENITTVKALLDEIENEALFNLLRSADKETLQILLLRMLGYSDSEIAGQMGLTEKPFIHESNRLKKKNKKIENGRKKIGKFASAQYSKGVIALSSSLTTTYQHYRYVPKDRSVTA